jgi:hypothetical protein
MTSLSFKCKLGEAVGSPAKREGEKQEQRFTFLVFQNENKDMG